MIKFIPKLVNISSPLSDPEGFAKNLANKSLSAQLNNRFDGRFCSDHPTFENTLLVHFQKNGDIITIQTYCCDKFKANLDLIAQNKDPYSSE